MTAIPDWFRTPLFRKIFSTRADGVMRASLTISWYRSMKAILGMGFTVL